jgi:hypothetical protein
MEASANSSQVIQKTELVDRVNEWIYRSSALRAVLKLIIWEKLACGEDTGEKNTSLSRLGPNRQSPHVRCYGRIKPVEQRESALFTRTCIRILPITQ